MILGFIGPPDKAWEVRGAGGRAQAWVGRSVSEIELMQKRWSVGVS